MTYRWRPTPDEERWLALAAKLGAAVPNAVSAARTGGWRSTGLLARAALFVLGLVAGGLLVGLLGFSSEITLLIAGLFAALAAEWLIVTRRLFASGIEEGLCVAGYLLVAVVDHDADPANVGQRRGTHRGAGADRRGGRCRAALAESTGDYVRRVCLRAMGRLDRRRATRSTR